MGVQVGIKNFDGGPVDTGLLRRLCDMQSQQSPDGEFCWTAPSISMVYLPFHTTKQSFCEKQPCRSDRGAMLTWDGRLDNRDELITDLHGPPGELLTDVDLVAASFDRWGTDCFRHLIGDWALCIWKPEERELLFAVDYMAIRHLFYLVNDHHVWWSSDIAPLVLLTENKLHIDEEFVAGYLAWEPENHVTPYREIQEVAAATFVRVRAGRAVVERYWRFQPRFRTVYKTDSEYEDNFRLVFREAVKRRLRSDRPVLAELSGGLDSSSIVCMADDLLATSGAETPRLDTLSYYDKTEPQGDDWLYFPKIEAKRGRPGAHIDTGKLSFDSPEFESTDFLPFPGYIGYGHELETERAEIIQQGGYRVILSGLGGDEFMGGIPNPCPHLADLILRFRFRTLGRSLVEWSLIKRVPLIHLLFKSCAELLPARVRKYFVRDDRIDPWIRKSFAKKENLQLRLLEVDEPLGYWLPTRRAFASGVVLMRNKLAKRTSPRLKTEELRFPFLDQSLIEFLLSIPADQLLRPGQRRSLMRRALVGLVPEEILSRKTKQFGSRTPILLLDKHWNTLQNTFAHSHSASRGYIDPLRFLQAVQEGRNGGAAHISRIMRMISLELWLSGLASRGLIADPSAPLEPVLTPKFVANCPETPHSFAGRGVRNP